jgi:hypothetical protein
MRLVELSSGFALSTYRQYYCYDHQCQYDTGLCKAIENHDVPPCVPLSETLPNLDWASSLCTARRLHGGVPLPIPMPFTLPARGVRPYTCWHVFKSRELRLAEPVPYNGMGLVTGQVRGTVVGATTRTLEGCLL